MCIVLWDGIVLRVQPPWKMEFLLNGRAHRGVGQAALPQLVLGMGSPDHTLPPVLVTKRDLCVGWVLGVSL